MKVLVTLLASSTCAAIIRAFQQHATPPRRDFLLHCDGPLPNQSSASSPPSTSSGTDKKSILHLDDLTVMDVVLFRRNADLASPPSSLELGAVQENGNISPLSTWTLESAYTSPFHDMMEFVVDEINMFPGLTSNDITICMLLESNVIGYGSRQVGGGKGPGNPHGEESELLYYVDRSVVEGTYYYGEDGDCCYKQDSEGEDGVEKKMGEEVGMKIHVVVNPSLEHLW
jgi:hypothetical protein